MHLIAYTSQYAGTEKDIQKVLDNIVATANTNNANLGITGVLLFDHDRFVQVIEGESEPLHALLHIITQDDRHDQVDVLIDTATERREFPDWHLEAFHIGGHCQFDEKLLEDFRQIYVETFKPSAKQLVRWINKLIEEPERFARVFTDSDDQPVTSD